MLQCRPIMQIVALPLNCIRCAILMSDFPDPTKREREQITRHRPVFSIIPLFPTDYSFPLEMGQPFYMLYGVIRCVKNVESLFRLHNYLSKNFFKSSILLSRNTRYFFLTFIAIVINTMQ